jgi:histidinol phosphatase-like PHP family hydrolase
VKFVVGSDAHSAGAVGNLRYCQLLMSAAGIGLSQLVDLKRMALARRAGA